MYSYISENNFVPYNQIIVPTGYIFKYISQKYASWRSSLQFGPGFDYVNHKILLAALNYFQGTIKKLVQILPNREKTDN